MLKILLAVCILYILLACKIVVSISANWVLATSTSLMMFCNWYWMSAMVSIPYIILCYFFFQSFLSLFNVVIKSMLLTVQEMYGLGEVGAVVNWWAIWMWFLIVGILLRCWFRVLPPLIIGFNLKLLSNSLELSPLHVITLFQRSIGHVHCCTSSNEPKIVCHVLIFCDF